jgi:hypothetical protein
VGQSMTHAGVAVEGMAAFLPITRTRTKIRSTVPWPVNVEPDQCNTIIRVAGDTATCMRAEGI